MNKFLLVGNKFTTERHLKQPDFTYSACGSFTKNKERTEGFLRIFKDMTAVSKNISFHVLDDIVNKYNNTVHRSIKIKPINVTSDSYAEYNENFNKKYPKFKVGDHVRTSKYKNIFDKGYTPNWSEEDFVVNKIKQN